MKLKQLLFIVLAMITQVQSTFGQIKSEDLSKIVEQARNKFNVPAIAITTMNSDSIFLHEIQGIREYGTENPVTANDYFHIGSCSKSVLAVIAGKLIETGKIKWKTKFFDVYTELKEQANEEYYNITLEDLFLCEAGIRAYTSLDDDKFPIIASTIENQRSEFIKYLIHQMPASKQNENGKFEHLYSNAGYTMASAMLEKVSGKSYEELIRHYFAGELNLKVYIGWPNNYNKEQPWGHMIADKQIEKFSSDHEYKLPYLLIPAGDLSMPTMDFAKYIQLHLKGLTGKDNFISANTYKYIHFGHKGFSIGVANNDLEGLTISGMDGSAGTFFCRAILVPKSDFAFTIMMNAGSGTGEMKAIDWITMKIVKIYYNWWWKFWM